MNTRDLQIVLKIADYRSITRAAEDFHMTQPAVSSALKRIEDELGCTLFVRQGKWLLQNEQGKQFCDAANELLGDYAHVREALRIQRRDEIIIEMCERCDRLYEHMGKFAEKNSDLRFVLRNETQAEDTYFYFSDFSLKMQRGLTKNESFLPLEARGALYAILPISHPLSGRTQINLFELQGERFVFLHDATDNGIERAYQLCLDKGVHPHIAMLTDGNSAKYSAIRRGCGIGLAFNHELSLAPQIKDCRVIPIADSLSVDWLCLAWHEEHISDAGRRFLEYLKGRV